MGTPAAPPATPEATTAPSCERCKTVAHPDSMLNFGFFHDYWLCRNTGECLTRLFEARRAARAADLEARRVRTITDPGSGTAQADETPAAAGAGEPEAVPGPEGVPVTALAALNAFEAAINTAAPDGGDDHGDLLAAEVAEEEAGTGHEAVPDSEDAASVPEPDSSDEGAEQ